MKSSFFSTPRIVFRLHAPFDFNIGPVRLIDPRGEELDRTHSGTSLFFWCIVLPYRLQLLSDHHLPPYEHDDRSGIALLAEVSSFTSLVPQLRGRLGGQTFSVCNVFHSDLGSVYPPPASSFIPVVR